MRRLVTSAQFVADGVTRGQLRSQRGRSGWTRVARGVYAEGSDPPSAVDLARAETLSAGGVASGTLAGVLHRLDGIALRVTTFVVPPGSSNHRRGAQRRHIAPDRVVVIDGVCCLDPLHTLLDLAHLVDDLVWEQALESALRRRLITIAALEAAAMKTFVGVERVRRVLALRPPGAPPTESLLETLFLQLARLVPGLGDPIRQHPIFDGDGVLIASVDFAWPDLGLFIELDGQHHLDQPIHDARRETAIVAATGWRCGRFTWHEVERVPRTTARRLAAIAEQCRRNAA